MTKYQSKFNPLRSISANRRRSLGFVGQFLNVVLILSLLYSCTVYLHFVLKGPLSAGSEFGSQIEDQESIIVIKEDEVAVEDAKRNPSSKSPNDKAVIVEDVSRNPSTKAVNDKVVVADAKRNPSTKAFKCKEPRLYTNPNFFKSQSEEDKQLLYGEGIKFDQICGGTYIEMGALDGKCFSNSFIFNKELDWKGLMVEASPTNYELLVQNRKNEIALVHAGVCSKEQDLHWVDMVNEKRKAVSGFLEFAPKSFIERYWSKSAIDNAQVVRCRTMQDIIGETVDENHHFDFFSLDVEGAEYEVLSSIDFDKVSFGIVFIEADDHNHEKNSDVKRILVENGYEFLYNVKRSDFFRHRNFDEIYMGIITQ